MLCIAAMPFIIPVIVLAGATFVGSFLSIQEEASRTSPPPAANIAPTTSAAPATQPPAR